MSPRLPGNSGEPRPTSAQQASRNNATLLGLVFLILCTLAFLALLATIFSNAAGLMLIPVGMAAFIAFHYFTWGIWLTRKLKDTEKSGDE